jgi:hypothetical protein
VDPNIAASTLQAIRKLLTPGPGALTRTPGPGCQLEEEQVVPILQSLDFGKKKFWANFCDRITYVQNIILENSDKSYKLQICLKIQNIQLKLQTLPETIETIHS